MGAFNEFCEQHGVHYQLTQSHALHQNGVVEMKNKLLIERAKKMALENRLLFYLCIKTVNIAAFLLNHSSTKANPNVTTIYLFDGKQLDLRIFKKNSCAIYVDVPKKNQFFFYAKSICCVFVSNDMHKKIYRSFELVTKKMIISKDVKFDEL